MQLRSLCLYACINYLSTFNTEHPVKAVRPTAIAAPPGWGALTCHDIIFILLLALAVTEPVLCYELPNGRKLGRLLPVVGATFSLRSNQWSCPTRLKISSASFYDMLSCMQSFKARHLPDRPRQHTSFSWSISSFVSSCGTEQLASALLGLSSQYLSWHSG